VDRDVADAGNFGHGEFLCCGEAQRIMTSACVVANQMNKGAPQPDSLSRLRGGGGSGKPPGKRL
jgi:hypothetical protein